MPEIDAISLRSPLEGQLDTHRKYVIAGMDDDDAWRKTFNTAGLDKERQWLMIFDGRYKLVLRPGKGPILFDMEADPLEDTTVAEQYPQVVARLRAHLEKEGIHIS
jgi:hypothetical protein